MHCLPTLGPPQHAPALLGRWFLESVKVCCREPSRMCPHPNPRTCPPGPGERLGPLWDSSTPASTSPAGAPLSHSLEGALQSQGGDCLCCRGSQGACPWLLLPAPRCPLCPPPPPWLSSPLTLQAEHGYSCTPHRAQQLHAPAPRHLIEGSTLPGDSAVPSVPKQVLPYPEQCLGGQDCTVGARDMPPANNHSTGRYLPWLFCSLEAPSVLLPLKAGAARGQRRHLSRPCWPCTC